MTVLDASAVLALLFNEPGSEAMVHALDAGDAVMSAVNVGEVASALHREEVSDAVAILRGLVAQVSVVPFDLRHAEMVGELLPLTTALGLSLGDRACLALARLRKEPVLTADRAWAELPGSVGVEVRLVR